MYFNIFVIGAVNGSYISIKSLKVNTTKLFFNHKGFMFSINV